MWSAESPFWRLSERLDCPLLFDTSLGGSEFHEKECFPAELDAEGGRAVSRWREKS